MGPGREVVQEEPEHPEVAGLGDALCQQGLDLVGAQPGFLRQREPVGDVDPEVVSVRSGDVPRNPCSDINAAVEGTLDARYAHVLPGEKEAVWTRDTFRSQTVHR